MIHKTETLNMRLTPQEKKIIQTEAEYNHQTVSSYLLMLVLNDTRRSTGNEPKHI